MRIKEEEPEVELSVDPKDILNENIVKGDTERAISPLKKEMAEILVLQIAHELYNQNLYKTFANYFGVKGFLKLEEYYLKRSFEEYNHSEWIREYLNDCDIVFQYPQIDKVEITINELIDPFLLTVDKEIDTTDKINEIAVKALSLPDLATFNFLQKLISEQIEEEKISRTILSIAKMEDSWLIKEEAILDSYNKD